MAPRVVETCVVHTDFGRQTRGDARVGTVGEKDAATGAPSGKGPHDSTLRADPSNRNPTVSCDYGGSSKVARHAPGKNGSTPRTGK